MSRCKAKVSTSIKNGRVVAVHCKRAARSHEGFCVQHLKQAIKAGKARKRLV